MTLIIAYFVTLIAFLALDYFGLSYIVRPVFDKSIGAWLLDDFRILPALAFYAFFVFGVVWFVSAPALNDGKSLLWVFLTAAFLGALAYGTYEFSNFATLKDWTAQMVIVDLIWGTVLTGTAATIAVATARAFT